MNILAIDQAIHTGWATCHSGKIESGVCDFSIKSHESRGMIYVKLEKWLNDISCDRLEFDLIIYEQTHHRGGAATAISGAMVGVIVSFAEKCNRPVNYTSVQSLQLKKATTGKGNATKADMMAWFKDKIGRDPISDDEADAMAMLYYAMDKYQPKGGK